MSSNGLAPREHRLPRAPILTFSSLTHLICTGCGVTYERDRRVNVCAVCGGKLFARYHERRLDRDALGSQNSPSRSTP